MLPRLHQISRSRDMIQEFGGLNHNVRANDNEFYLMENTASDHYPTLSPRKPRGEVMTIENCGGLLAKDKLVYIEDNILHYGDTKVQLNSSTYKERQLVSMGAYIIVFPDFIYLNTADLSDRGEISLVGDGSFPTEGNDISFTLCDKDGNAFPIMYIKSSEWDEDLVTPAETPIDKYGIALAPYEAAQQAKYNEDYYWGKLIGLEYLWRKTYYNLPIGKKIEVANYYRYYYNHETYDEPWNFYAVMYEGKEYRNVTGAGNYIGDDKEILVTISRTDNVVYLTCVKPFSGVKVVDLMYHHPISTGAHIYCYIECKSYVYPSEGEIMLDNSAVPTTMKRYTNGEWKEIESYVKINTVGIGKSPLAEINKLSIYGDSTGALRDLISNYETAVARINILDSDNVVLPGVLSGGVINVSNLNDTTITIKGIYNFDYVVESQNRLWACRYGEDDQGKKINRIYASALGDFKNWSEFNGVDDDPYFVNLGSDGEFTGAINYNGYPIFFKENCIHKVYGNYPSSYQISTENSVGVQKGSAKALQVVAGNLIFKAVDGIYAYDGANTSLISEKLGAGRFSEAIAGNVDNKYYVSMVSAADNERHIYVYDLMKGIWNVEDDPGTRFMAKFDDNLYIATKNDKLITVKDKAGSSVEEVRWYAETGIIGYSDPDSKYVSQIQIRISLDIDAEVNLFIEYDSNEDFIHKGPLLGTRLQSFTLPIMPRRCDHFRLRFEGKGACKIFSITKVLENGGRV